MYSTSIIASTDLVAKLVNYKCSVRCTANCTDIKACSHHDTINIEPLGPSIERRSQQWLCIKCLKNQKSAKKLKFHLEQVHKLICNFICSFCEKKCSSLSQVMGHYRFCNARPYAQLTIDENLSTTSSPLLSSLELLSTSLSPTSTINIISQTTDDIFTLDPIIDETFKRQALLVLTNDGSTSINQLLSTFHLYFSQETKINRPKRPKKTKETFQIHPKRDSRLLLGTNRCGIKTRKNL